MRLLLLCSLALFLSYLPSVEAQETDNLRLFAYEPKCSDYILGYSIDLMAEGRLVGHPKQSCTVSVDYSNCTNTLCRVGVQLRQWQTCVEEKAKEKLETNCRWNSEGAPLDVPVGSGSVDPVGSGPAAEECYDDAVSALRERMTILLSPSVPPEEQQIALSFNDQRIAILKNYDGKMSNVVCGVHMNLGKSFPDLPTTKALRIALLTARSEGAARQDLFSIIRLAFESDRIGINLPREAWFACFTDLEVEFFVYRRPINELISDFKTTCGLFLDDHTKMSAMLDFEAMRI